MKRLLDGVPALVLFLNLFVSFSSGKPNEVCISQGGRFPSFSSHGKPPKRASRGPKDLTLCRVFRAKTCCDVAQTHPALLSLRRLATTGEASKDCLDLWEILECSICHPHVGIQPGPPVICASLCEKVFEACSAAYFSMDAKTQVLAPCGANDLICGRASEWISNGTELCRAAGFAVKPSDIGMEDVSCYGGKASIDTIAGSWKGSQSDLPKKKVSREYLEDFLQWLGEMPLSERVSWTVGGMVLTAGLLFRRRRTSHSQRQKLAAIKRTAKRLETKMSKNSSRDLGSRKLLGR